MPPRNENIRIKDILDAIERIHNYIQDIPLENFVKDQKTIDAVAHNFSIIGESASKVSAVFRKKNNQVPWEKMIAMRNFIIHEYFLVSPQVLWLTSRNDLPNLLQSLNILNDTPLESKKNEPHQWRLCPEGQHWVRTHKRRVEPSKQHPDGKTTVTGHCANNPSGKDVIYPIELDAIAKKYFDKLKGPPCADKLGYQNGNEYDSYIRGWTKYWNEVLQPEDPLDPNLVKALIATESGFRPNAKNKVGKNKGFARGLMQITDQTQKILVNENGELKDHLVIVNQNEMSDPNSNIAAGVRWLFRKKEIADSKNPNTSWIDTIAQYKAYPVDHEQMQKLKKLYKKLEDCNSDEET